MTIGAVEYEVEDIREIRSNSCIEMSLLYEYRERDENK